MLEHRISKSKIDDITNSRTDIRNELISHGFNLYKNWTQHLDAETLELVFRQQEK